MSKRDSAVVVVEATKSETVNEADEKIENEGVVTNTSVLLKNTTTTTSSNIVANVNPLYITIGPPCAGKTTWIFRSAAAHSTVSKTDNGATESHPSNHQKSSMNDTTTNMIQDVSLDDQKGVYHALPCRYFLDSEMILQKQQQRQEQQQQEEKEDIAKLQTVLYGKTIAQRIQDPEQLELRLVLQRINQRLTTTQFEVALTDTMNATHYTDGIKRTIVTEYISVLEEEIALLFHSNDSASSTTSTPTEHKKLVPKTVDLFVREAIFRPDPLLNSSTALERAYEALRFAITNNTAVAVAWGNTNTKPSDYKLALQIASETNRPVYFVVYKDDLTITRLKERNRNSMETPLVSESPEVGQEHKRCDNTVQNEYDHDTIQNTKKEELEEDPGMEIFEDDVFDLFAENFRELLRRNLRRLIHSGRYVPASVIWDMRIRTAESVKRVLDMWKNERSDRNHRMTKLEFHQCLARVINFEMGNDRTVRPIETTIPTKKPRRDDTRPNGNNYYHTGERNQRVGNYSNSSRANTGNYENNIRNRQRPWDRPQGARINPRDGAYFRNHSNIQGGYGNRTNRHTVFQPLYNERRTVDGRQRVGGRSSDAGHQRQNTGIHERSISYDERRARGYPSSRRNNATNVYDTNRSVRSSSSNFTETPHPDANRRTWRGRT
jgi:hypothetical protein